MLDSLLRVPNQQQMLNFIKRLKLSYQVYNFFKKKELIHNEKLYKKYGLKKHYYSSVSSKDFEGLDTPHIKADLEGLMADPLFKKLSEASQRSLADYDKTGYALIKDYFTSEQIDSVNEAIDELIKSEKVHFRYNNKKIMFAIHKSKTVRQIGYDKTLSKIFNYLMGGEAVLFQSINFVHEGSEQKTHSDSLHMTTYPLGGLLGVWIALEDIHEDNGPLHYYPGSHKLPYFLNADFDNVGTKWMLGKKKYADYESMIERKLKEYDLEKKLFTAKKGDILLWHANLLHGGEAHLNKSKTRKSMVFHYFERDSICYHEVTQRPAIMKKQK